MISDKRVYLNSDKTKVVDESSDEAAHLLVGEGCELSDELAAKYGLLETEGKAVNAPPENKAIKKEKHK